MPASMGQEFFDAMAGVAATTSLWEVAAVLLAVIYLLLAIREHPGCWPAAILSSLIYVVLLGEQQLYMEAALQVFYVAMAVYGWWAWRPAAEGGALVVHVWPWRWHAGALLLVGLLSLASGRLLATNTAAALPYLDSSITWASLLATWMVARKVLENWLYWFAIDSLSLGVFLSRGLYLTAVLFAVYLVLIVIGYRRWRGQLLKNRQ
jgi:nicotinamide mononucleotide transporter